MPRFTKDLALVLLPKLLNGSATFGLNVYAFRHLDVAEYGVASFCLTCLQVMDGLFGSAFDVAVTRTLHEKPESSVPAAVTDIERTAIASKLLLGLAAIAILLIAGESIASRIFHRSGDGLTLTYMLATATCILLVRSIQLAFQVRLHFLPYGLADILQTTLRIALVVAGFAWGFANARWLVLSFGLAALITAAAFIRQASGTGLISTWFSGRFLWQQLWERSRTLLVTSGLGSVLNRLDIIILGIVSNTKELGMYGAALAIAIVPEVLAMYTAPVLLPRLLPAKQNGTLRKLFLTVHGAAYFCVIVTLLAVWIIPDSVFSLIFPERYAASIGILRYLLPGLLASASLLPLTLNLLLLTKPKTILYIDLATVPLIIISYTWFGHLSGAIGVAVSLTFIRLLKMVVMQICAWKSTTVTQRTNF